MSIHFVIDLRTPIKINFFLWIAYIIILQSVLSAKKYMLKAKLRWWGYLNRLDPGRQVKNVWEAKKNGKSSKGRPRKIWDEEIAKILEEKGVLWREAKEMTKDRIKWRNGINEI